MHFFAFGFYFFFEILLFAGMTNLTQGLKVEEKGREAPIGLKEIKLMSQIDLKSGKKVKPVVEERDQWSSPLDFIISMIAYAVGLGESRENDKA